MTTMISASAHAEKNTTAKARHAASKVVAGIVDPGLTASPMPATRAEDAFTSGNARGRSSAAHEDRGEQESRLCHTPDPLQAGHRLWRQLPSSRACAAAAA